jgi:hypothetical protein
MFHITIGYPQILHQELRQASHHIAQLGSSTQTLGHIDKGQHLNLGHRIPYN